MSSGGRTALDDGGSWGWRPGIRRESRVNYARRQQYRRLSRAGLGAAASRVACCGLGLVSSGASRSAASCYSGVARPPFAALALTRHSSRVGARSEDEVQRVLAPLEGDGWRLRHSLPWRGRGTSLGRDRSDRVAFAIETRTRTYDGRHLARVREQAAWLSRRRRRWARNGALGVMCVVRARGIERVEHDVLVVSIDRVHADVLRIAAGMSANANSRT